MPEEIFYEFDSIRVSSLRPHIFHGEESVPLTPTAFALLLVFVQNPGLTLSKTELIKRVWADNIVTENNFNVTLNAVRRALRESGRHPRYIFKVTSGYRFIADVREIKAEAAESSRIEIPPEAMSAPAPSDVQSVQSASPTTVAEVDRSGALQLEDPLQGHQPPLKTNLAVPDRMVGFPWTHLWVSSSLYAALYTCALFLEVSYRWETFATLAAKLALPVFFLIFATSITALVLDWKWTMTGKSGGLMVTVLVFVVAVFLLYVTLGLFLPDYPITEARFQTRSAHAAYLKDLSYFLPLGIVFIVLPFHFVASVRKQLEAGHHHSVLALLNETPEAVAPSGAIYVRAWWLSLLLCAAAVISLLFTNHLLDNLQPGAHKNLFTQLVMWRLLLYFALGLECLLWYYRYLNEIKYECLRSLEGACSSLRQE